MSKNISSISQVLILAKLPGNLRQTKANQEVIETLMQNPAVRRIAGFGDGE